jgi:pantoate--beta-alanine ligase
MRTIATIAEVRDAVRHARRAGKRIAFVPTMGFLHEGHMQLVDGARRHADLVVMSIFVNPLQFAPTEDLSRYPRDIEGDSRQAEARGVDLLFVPEVSEIYPAAAGAPDSTRVVPRVSLASRWEGAVRPGHFAGVLTVVAKLFNIVQPDVAVFGRKDFQQAALVRAMVQDLDMPIEVIVAPTTRSEDGLALSSRNSYLSADDRRRALAIPGALAAMDAAFARGERDTAALVAEGRAILDADASLQTDYLALVDPDEMAPVTRADSGSVAIAAVRVGSTRLIDNRVLGA